ncbi:MAG: M28 family peptidase [Chthoniobacteraceae bacterium]
MLFAACGRRPVAPEGETAPAEAAPPPGASPAASKPVTTPPVKLPPLAAGPAELWKEFSGARAFEEVRQQVAIGARPSGSPGVEKTRALIEASLKKSDWEVERQTFTDETPRGPIIFVNLIARFVPPGLPTAPRHTQRAIVCSHYDTKRFSTINFLGASDGASSTGALLELARVLALAPSLAVQVELVFFDGEEAIVQYSEKDGLYGSRHYASNLRGTGRAAQFKFGILWDMIGDKDFGITLSPDSPQELTRDLLAAADALKVREKFSFYDRNIYDDHVPLNTIAKIPTIDLIDFDYLYWHTADDTLERLGPDGLQHTGAVTLYQLRRALK